MIKFKKYPLDDEWNTYAKVGVEYGVLTAYISCIGHGTSFYGKILIGDRSDVRETVNNAVAIALSQLNAELIEKGE